VNRRNLGTQDDWIETPAEVTSSTHHFARLLEIDLETPSDRSFYFVIFTYEVSGKRYTESWSKPSPPKLAQS